MSDLSTSANGTSVLLTVVIPVFNEAATIDRVVDTVLGVDVEKEIIVVDDGSTDGTAAALDALASEYGNIRIWRHERNRGKGAALRTGFTQASGRFVIVQDADLEYDPAEYPRLLAPLVDGTADVVYGSRFLGDEHERSQDLLRKVGNRWLTRFSNWYTGLDLTDMETCFKVFRREIIQDISIEEDGFGVEPELTAKLADYRRAGKPLRIREIGISYHGRSYAEGKKIGWRDAVHAVRCVVRYSARK